MCRDYCNEWGGLKGALTLKTDAKRRDFNTGRVSLIVSRGRFGTNYLLWPILTFRTLRDLREERAKRNRTGKFAKPRSAARRLIPSGQLLSVAPTRPCRFLPVSWAGSSAVAP